MIEIKKILFEIKKKIKFKINLRLTWIPFLNYYNHGILLIDIKMIFKNKI